MHAAAALSTKSNDERVGERVAVASHQPSELLRGGPVRAHVHPRVCARPPPLSHDDTVAHVHLDLDQIDLVLVEGERAEYLILTALGIHGHVVDVPKASLVQQGLQSVALHRGNACDVEPEAACLHVGKEARIIGVLEAGKSRPRRVDEVPGARSAAHRALERQAAPPVPRELGAEARRGLRQRPAPVEAGLEEVRVGVEPPVQRAELHEGALGGEDPWPA
mmetsp:Transcript_111698/g.339614  ORF Transcript_111698/g.339614 Transcript_111698/m.339614 type:complete len:221 (+) Transcript_111698:161-823(+)